MMRPVGPNWSSGCAASRSRRSVWRRAEGTNAARCEPCLRPACRARQVNPFKLRQFARASGVLAKNDPLDTRMIASFVAIMPTQPAQPRAPAIERLTEMLAVRRQLNAEKVAAENASRLLDRSRVRRAEGAGLDCECADRVTMTVAATYKPFVI